MYGRNEIKKIRQQYAEYMDSSTPVSSDVSSAHKSSSARQQMKTAGLMRRSANEADDYMPESSRDRPNPFGEDSMGNLESIYGEADAIMNEDIGDASMPVRAKSNYKFDGDERKILAQTIMAEAGTQSKKGMLAVGAVIDNRRTSGSYGDKYSDVILAPGQFSPWNSVTGFAGGEQGQDMSNVKPSAKAYAAADKVLAGGYTDVTNGSLNFYNPDISNPKWGPSNRKDWITIGGHIFGTAKQKGK